LSIIRCAADSDVAAALAFAQGRGLEVSVRGGGRNYAGSSLTDGGVMIDLSSMKVVTVDASTKRATCGGGGTTWGELDSATQEHGLAVTGGFVSKTGVAGLTLGGGIGWLVRKAGLSCDNLVGAQVVTADGQTRHAIATENADLFWAIRGGGGNFGVVTEFEFTLHEVGPLVHLGLFLFSPDHGGDLFRFAREYVRTVPEDYGVFMAGLSAPQAPFVPPELHHTPAFGLLGVGVGDEARHAEVIAPIPQALDPVVSMVTPIAYAAPQQMFDESAPCTGSYVNFMTDHDAERVRNAYRDKYRRLQQIKATYDPDSTSTRI
jgi:FAD/FMN-containing dehydrogenase